MVEKFFGSFSKSAEKRFTFFITLLMVITIIVMRYFDAPLKNEVSKHGIISFELAKDLIVSKEILNSWNVHAKISASMSMGFDFLFLLIYKINNQYGKNFIFYKFGKLLMLSIFFAALFDVVENIALIKLLLGDLKQYWSTIAYYFAFVKFTIVAVCIVYILLSWFGLLIKKLKPMN
jgi:hypothetical protein